MGETLLDIFEQDVGLEGLPQKTYGADGDRFIVETLIGQGI